MTQYHFDPATYLDLMRAEVPAYGRLQEAVAGATEGVRASSLLDLGAGTGETLAAVLARHPGCAAVGIDKSAGMLEAATTRLAGYPVELTVADLADPLPQGPFDLVISALAVHHLEGPAKADLFARVAAVLRLGGRFVLGDVVVPDDPADATTPLTPGYDRPSPLVAQVLWLEEAGLIPRVVWEQGDLAVVAARRN